MTKNRSRMVVVGIWRLRFWIRGRARPEVTHRGSHLSLKIF
jgi:hypothetical protein